MDDVVGDVRKVGRGWAEIFDVVVTDGDLLASSGRFEGHRSW